MPVFAIAAILVADASSALYAAVIGMILGQLANICVVFFIAHLEGYALRPGAMQRNSSFEGMARNYGWLVLAALVVNIANPINYWFAGKLAIGSLSTWAMGSKLIQLVSGLTAAIMASVAPAGLRTKGPATATMPSVKFASSEGKGSAGRRISGLTTQK